MGDFIHFHILNILGALDNLFYANQKMKTLFNLEFRYKGIKRSPSTKNLHWSMLFGEDEIIVQTCMCYRE